MYLPARVAYADIDEIGEQAIFLFTTFNYTSALWREYRRNETPVT